jgi:hypothetical protein
MINVVVEEDDNYYDDNLKRVISKCYDVLQTRNSIVGEKALEDIIRLFTVHILKLEFQNKTSELYKRCQELDDSDNKQYFIDCTIDLRKLAVNGHLQILHQWKLFVNYVLIDVLDYNQKDITFNCNDCETVDYLIQILSNELIIDEKFIDFFVNKYNSIDELFVLIKNDVIV